jgi:hypothetical protein
MERDRDLYRDIETMVAVMRSGAIVADVEKEIGELRL